MVQGATVIWSLDANGNGTLLGSDPAIVMTKPSVGTTLLRMLATGDAELASSGGVVVKASSAETARFQGAGGLTLKEKASGPTTSAGEGSFWVKNSTPSAPWFSDDDAGVRALVQSSSASSTDNRVARFDGTTGAIVQDSSLTIDDSGNLIVDNSDFIYWGSSSSQTWISGNSVGNLTLQANSDVSIQNSNLTLTNGSDLRWGGSSNTSIAGSSTAGGDLTLNANDDLFLNPADDVVVRVGGTTYATFDGSAQGLAIGTTAASSKLHVVGTADSAVVARFNNQSTNSGSDGVLILLDVAAANTGNRFLQFSDGGGVVGSVAGDGTGVSYNVTSDARVKQNVRDAPELLPTLLAIPIREFEYRSAPRLKRVGVIAQELAPLWPQATTDPASRNDRSVVTFERSDRHGHPVRTETLADAARVEALRGDPAVKVIDVAPLTEEHPEFSYWGVDYSKLAPLLIKAVQEQQAVIDALKARIEALEAR